MDKTMDMINETLITAKKTVDKNANVSFAITFFLILYAALIAPKLPEKYARIFDNTFFKFAILILVAYYARDHPANAILAIVGLIITYHTLYTYDVDRKIYNIYQRQRANLMDFVQRRPDEGIIMEEDVEPESKPSKVTEEALSELQYDDLNKTQECPTGGCGSTSYKNNFYPQYAHMKPDAYKARYTGNDVYGYDPMSTYARNY